MPKSALDNQRTNVILIQQFENCRPIEAVIADSKLTIATVMCKQLFRPNYTEIWTFLISRKVKDKISGAVNEKQNGTIRRRDMRHRGCCLAKSKYDGSGGGIEVDQTESASYTDTERAPDPLGRNAHERPCCEQGDRREYRGREPGTFESY